MIKCNVCGHDNPLGRVHCVQCGTKIDLSKVVPESMGGGQGNVVIKKTRGGAGGGSSGISKLIKFVDAIILAALVIGIAMMWQVPQVKEIANDPAAAMTAKAKFDSLAAAQQGNSDQVAEFTEQEINSYINEPSSPRHFEYPEDSGGVLSSRFTRYQFEFGENEATAVAVGFIRLKDLKKKIVIRASGTLGGESGNRQVKLKKLFIGSLPLHSLPFSDKFLQPVADQFFRFQPFEQEWKVLKGTREVQFAGGKAVVASGGPAASSASRK